MSGGWLITSRMMNRFYLYLFSVLCLSCDSKELNIGHCYNKTDPPRNHYKVSITQGLWGDVWFWSGDFMPFGRGEICQVKRTILIFELTGLNEVEQIGYSTFYSKIHTNLIRVVESGLDGFFQVELPPGSYSLFVMEDEKFYSNSFTSDGIFPVAVEEDQVTEVRIDITYQATF
jgi:hypothetical protein